MGFQYVPVWDLNGSDPYKTLSSISYIHVATATIRRFFFIIQTCQQKNIRTCTDGTDTTTSGTSRGSTTLGYIIALRTVEEFMSNIAYVSFTSDTGLYALRNISFCLCVVYSYVIENTNSNY